MGTEGTHSAIDSSASEGSGTARVPRFSWGANTHRTTANAVKAAPRTTTIASLDTPCAAMDIVFYVCTAKPITSGPGSYLRLGTRSRVMVCESVMAVFTVAAAPVS